MGKQGRANMEIKSFQVIDQASDGRTVTGIAAVFGNQDDGGDRILPGAFTKTIQERGPRLRHLWQHDFTSPPIAAIRDIHEVGFNELPEKAKQAGVQGGLLVAREYLDTPRGNEVLAGIQAGAINEMSFGFDAIKSNTDKKTGGRELTELRLWETSDVLWGMNPLTAAAKGIPQVTVQHAIDEISRLVALDEKVGRVLSARNLERLKAALDTLAEILLAAEPPDTEQAKALTLQAIMQRLKIYEHDLSEV